MNLRRAGKRSTLSHLRYIERDGVSREGNPGKAYGPLTDQADVEAFEARGREDRHQFRFIVSPEDAEQLDDLRTDTRHLMSRMEADLGTRLDWVAVDHWNTDNPHTHIVLHGKDDIGLGQSAEVGEDLVAKPIWFDPLVVTIPARHPLLTYRHVPLDEVIRYPLVLCDPQVCEGFWRQLQRVLGTVDARLTIADRVPTLDLMMALVAAGYGLGFSSLARITELNNPEVVARPLAGCPAMLTTYPIRRKGEPAEQLARFFDRVSPTENRGVLSDQSRAEEIA
ncbi:LysR family substrate-binding domain-containing protein [Metapseudomonas resinovorans]|uniref:LysR substrate-binding domain-containing protein n=1 Tax=Metapseudomonas resinovorans NBRC 106553 TaxID=1245471 RepID=S6AT50_METRE|nr:hypothetical protein PCA10_35460 [Pseudomonas resinovorans NBRC 106553]